MGAFSTKMRNTASTLIESFGNSCVLEKVTTGGYDVTTGKAGEAITRITTYSAPTKDINIVFGNDGSNTNLTGFGSKKVTVAYLGVDEVIDESWRYDGSAITLVEPVEAQNEIIVFNLTIASS